MPELWMTDGTAEGAVLLLAKENPCSLPLRDLRGVNGTLFFISCGSSGVHELWKSDGTPEGTVRFRPVDLSSNPPVVFKGALYFADRDATAGLELWRSDGTEAGTVRVKDLHPGAGDSSPRGLLTVSDTLYFFASEQGFSEASLWKSDGTEAGTVKLAGGTFFNPEQLTAVGDTLYFAATGSAGMEPWKSDGTEAGTVLVADVAPGSVGSAPQLLLGHDGLLYFSAEHPSFGRELWALPLAPIRCPGPVFIEATRASGVEQGFWPEVTLAPGVSTSLPVSYSPELGEPLPMGTIQVSASASDAAWPAAGCRFTVTVRDTTAPQLQCPAPLSVEATGAEGARVQLPTVTATDALFPPQVTLSHASGADFALGSTPVTATARDEAGNTSTCTFSVLVRDTTAPVVTCPADVTVESPHRMGGEMVRFPPPEATDAVSAPTVRVSPETGTLFRPGTTRVTAVAVDAANNAAQCAFNVTVNEPSESSGGGGCAATPGSPASWWLLLGGLALHLGTRRRARA